MNRGDQSVDGICNYRCLSDRVGTAGQPLPAQFAAIAAAGYQVVINLALPDSTNALPNEQALVEDLGMIYIAVPVVWEDPRLEDLRRFFAVMDEHRERSVFVHCALNWRVSCFMFLYQVLVQGIDLGTAKRELLAVWQPNATWQRFLDDALTRI